MLVPDLSPHVALAHALADVSGDIIRPLFRTGLTVDDKADHTPVTAADRNSEQAMRDMIARRFPEHGVIGEEFGREREGAEFVWVLDPVDGTGALISGLATFGTLIALCYRGQPILGIINQPVLNERWIGVEGQGTLFNGQPTRVRSCDRLDRATLFTTSIEAFKTEDDVAAYQRLAGLARLRRFGCDCYAYGLLALGCADLVCETGLKVYDYMALAPVVIGAGGTLTDWDNRPVGLSSFDRVLASASSTLHRQALEQLKSAP